GFSKNKKFEGFINEFPTDKYFVFGRLLKENKIIRETGKSVPFWKCSWKGFDPKDYWEIARGWQWLPANLEADESNRSLVIEKIIAWLEANPYPNGLAWAVGLDVAIRSINLLLIYEISQDDRLINYLWQHYLYLKKMLWLSKNAIRNNHYLGELTTLTILVKFFGLSNFKKLRKCLTKEIMNQFYEDGVNKEQSIRYHKFSLEFVILAHLFLDIKSPVLGKAAEFILATMKLDRTWPSIGDDDMGCVIRLHNEPINGDYLAILSLIGLLLKSGKIKYITKNLSNEAKLLLKDSEKAWEEIKEEEPEKTYIFENGGYLIHRTGWTENDSYFLLKFGPHKWHAHADLFHIELMIKGTPILIDSGTYRYNNVPEERKYFRSTAAHNTMEFDGLDQTKQWTTFRWHKAAKVIDWKIDQNNESIFFTGAHDGYKNRGVIHRRTIKLEKNLKMVDIADSITGNGKGICKVYWHFHPEVTIEINSKNTVSIARSGKVIGRIQIKSGKPVLLKKTETLYSKYYTHLSTKHTLVIEFVKANKKIINTAFDFSKDYLG
ncbi:MAG TPA: hypothetical protein ENL09_01275, partial [Bacteroidetes bacterium]|nr:hypothetical protein [Bacteroidota bacterium]